MSLLGSQILQILLLSCLLLPDASKVCQIPLLCSLSGSFHLLPKRIFSLLSLGNVNDIFYVLQCYEKTNHSVTSSFDALQYIYM